MDQPARPAGSQARKLIAATLALAGCRIVSQWSSLVAGFAALIIILVLAVNLVAGMPRLRRVLLFAAWPASALASAVAFAFGTFVVLLGTKGLLDNGEIGHPGPAWNVAFALVPLAAAANLVWLARPTLPSRWLGCVWLANLALAAYSLWCWQAVGMFSVMQAVPLAPTILSGLSVLSMATLAWEARALASSNPAGPRRGRRVFVSVSALLIVAAVWLALVPVYKKRQVARSLEAFGFGANFGVIFPAWKSPIDVPFEWYEYLGEVSGATAFEATKGDVGQAGRLLNSLPWLNFIMVNELPVGGDRILEPLAGHPRLRQVALKGVGVTDSTLVDAARIPALNSAGFERAQITDAGLASLAGLQWLQYLNLRQTPISGDGLVHLRSLPRLSGLDLSATNVGDRQLAELPRFKALINLSLENTPVTDAGLPSLARCKTLKHINLTGTRVTEGGVEQLRAALPGCDVWYRPDEE